MGITFVPITLLATGGVSATDAGLASGLFNTAQQVGGALGLAILSTLAVDHTSSILHGLGHAVTPARTVAATVSGYNVAFGIAAGMLGAAGLLLALLLRRRHVEGIALDPNAIAAGVPAA
jgi:hypothetical protein